MPRYTVADVPSAGSIPENRRDPAAATAASDEHAKKIETALVRAQWFVIQTGLITTGLALFGVYVLANRINDMHVMTLYVRFDLSAVVIVRRSRSMSVRIARDSMTIVSLAR